MASASTASSGIVYEVLSKDNYKNWSTLVKNYLVGQGLWHGVVEGDQPKRKDDADQEKAEKHKDDDWEWESKKAQALHAIQLSCGSETLGHIRQFETAREVWNHLKASFTEDVKAYQDIEQGRDTHRYIDQLHRDVKRGYWNDAKSYINRFPDAIFSTSYSTGRTVLHVAVASGQEGIVKELVKIGNTRLLKMQDKRGYTALALAAELTDNKDMAEWMVSKGGEDLLTIKTKEDGDKGEIPLLLASAKGHTEMTRYLFSRTPSDLLRDHQYGTKLLAQCISMEIFDVAAALLQHRVGRQLSLEHESDYYLRPLYALAHMPSAFRSGTQIRWWQRFIYKILRLPTHISLMDKFEIVLQVEPDEGPDENTIAGKICRLVLISVTVKHIVSRIGLFFGRFQQFVQNFILLRLPGFKKVYEMKKNNYLVLEILKCFRKRVSRMKVESELRQCSAYDAMLQAAKYGIIEFIDSMRSANPDLLLAMDKNKRDVFSHAVINRQEKVFHLIHETEGRQEIIASRQDVFDNNMLHLAAELGPSSSLSCISNAALQMQRELQWFTAVKSIVPPKCKEAKNKDGKKPHEVFTKTHQELVKAGQKWAKETASSFTLVGTLIITIMFAAAFTIPGGNNQETGVPLYLNKDAFTVFITADAVSLITSSSSVLLFIGILTSRYAEEDFRNRLPLMLLFGLFTLFLSVVSMMFAFCAALSMMLEGYRRLVMAAMLLAVIPVVVFIPTQLGLFIEIVKSTITIKFDLLTTKKKKFQD